MKRREATPLIDEYLATHEFLVYMNPVMGLHFNIERRLVENPIFAEAVPDFLDRQRVIGVRTMAMYDRSPIQLVEVPKQPTTLMGQLEFFLNKVPVYLIHHKGEWWIAAEEFFPFD